MSTFRYIVYFLSYFLLCCNCLCCIFELDKKKISNKWVHKQAIFNTAQVEKEAFLSMTLGIFLSEQNKSNTISSLSSPSASLCNGPMALKTCALVKSPNLLPSKCRTSDIAPLGPVALTSFVLDIIDSHRVPDKSLAIQKFIKSKGS